MPFFTFCHRAASAAALVLPLVVSFAAAAQTLRPPLAAPVPVPTFSELKTGRVTPAGRACQQTRLAGYQRRQAALTQRVASSSRNQERLMNRYNVTYAHLDIALERNATTLGVGSNVRTWARNRGAGVLDTLGFELHPSLTLDSVQVNGARVATARIQRLTTGDVRVRPAVAPAAGAAFDYQVWYHGTPASTGAAAIGDGITAGTSPSWGNEIVWTLSEPYSAYEWWPCKQTLSDKFDSVAVWITTDAANKAGSNGALTAVTPRPGGKARYEWKTRYPIAYYLISVTVAEYVDYTIYAHPAGLPAGDSLPIVNYVYNNPGTLPYWQNDIDATAGMIENYSAKISLYPFWREKYGHCMAPLGGGMEHQTMTTQGTFEFTLTAHELFHQWFGDNATCRSWRDIWLNESFASYGEYMSLQALQPADADGWMANTRQAALSQTVGSVAVPDTLDPNRIFDYYLVYMKGATVVHMLRYVTGTDSLFYAVLRNYQRDFTDSVATTADFQHSAETTLGRPLGWFFDQWIAGEGHPLLDARWNQVGSQLVVAADQTTTAPGVTPFFQLPFDVRVTFAAGGPAPIKLRVEQTQPSQTWTLPLPAGATVQRIQVDPEEWDLMEVQPEQRDNTLQPTTPAGLAAGATLAPLAPFPNPCSDHLRLPADDAARVAEVLDLTGRVVLRQTLAAHATDLATQALASGTYVLRLRDADGSGRQARFVRQ